MSEEIVVSLLMFFKFHQTGLKKLEEQGTYNFYDAQTSTEWSIVQLIQKQYMKYEVEVSTSEVLDKLSPTPVTRVDRTFKFISPGMMKLVI